MSIRGNFAAEVHIKVVTKERLIRAKALKEMKTGKQMSLAEYVDDFVNDVLDGQNQVESTDAIANNQSGAPLGAPKWRCPDCDKPFGTLIGVQIHRGHIHGVKAVQREQHSEGGKNG